MAKRKNQQAISVYIPDELHTRMLHYKADNKVKQKDLVVDAITEYLDRKTKKTKGAK